MKRHIEAESCICGTGIGHKKIVLQKDKGIVPCIDAELWYANEVRRRKASRLHQKAVIVA